MLAGFLIANIAIVVVAAVVLLNRPAPPPHIQGVLLSPARDLPPFRLLDHRNDVFTNEELKGRWGLVSYGFTTCPDVCPTTLAALASVHRQLQEQGDYDLRILFYTVDHARDTVAQMAAYVPYFDPEFIGLTYLDNDDDQHLPFEQGLGIVAQLLPEPGSDTNSNDYQVVHGVKLFLINPQGQLQAILDPDNSVSGTHTFDPATVLRDYLAIRHYLD